MQRKFLANILWMVLLNLIVKPFSIIGIDAEVQNRVGSEDYGMYYALLNFTFLFNIVLDFGISNFNTKYVAQYPHLVKRYIGRFLSLKLILFFFYCLCTLGLSYLFSYNARQYEMIYLLIANQLLVSFILFFRTYFAGLLLFKYDILLSVLDRFLLIFFAGYFLYVQPDYTFTIDTFIDCMFWSYFVAFVLGLCLLVRKVGIPQFRFSKSISYVILRNSFPYALLIFLMMMYNRMDSVLIESLHERGAYEAGIYAQAYRITDACMMFTLLFTGLLYPMFSKMLKEKEDVVPLLQLAYKILLSGAIIGSSICIFYAEFILNLIYDRDIQESIPVFRYLMLSFIFMCVVQLFGTILTANGQLRSLNILSGLGLLLSLLANTYMIPHYGALGSSIVSVFVQGLLAVSQVYLVLRTFRFSPSIVSLLRFGLFLSILGFALYLLPTFSLTLGVQIILILILSALSIFLLKIVDLRSILQILKSK